MAVPRVYRSSFVRSSLAALALAACALPAHAQDSTSAFWSLPWEKGPTVGRLGDLAQVQVPEGYVFTGKAGTKRFMEMTQNPVNGDEYGTLVPAAQDQNWFVIFEYHDIGYVKDDDKDKIDPAAMLKALQEGSQRANKERHRRGWTEMDVVGWSSPPTYNPETHNLEWGIRGVTRERDGSQRSVVNHSIRVLGRNGVMSCDIVASPEQLETALASFRTILPQFAYLPGKRYFEFKQGDKLAAVGLTGLVVGGAAVAAAKSGLLAKLLKPLLIALAALFATIGRWFKQLFGNLFRRDETVGS